MATPLISENFGHLLAPGLRKVFDDSYKRIPPMVPDLFNITKSNKAVEYDLQIGAFGDFSEFTGKISYDDITMGYRATYEHTEYASGFQVERKLADDDLYNIISKKPAGLGISAARSREKSGAAILNTAFSGTTGPDSYSLCYDSHPTRVSGGVTFDNKGDTALSATAVEATRLLMMAYKDDRNNLIHVMPDLLIVPPSLEETAWEIIASKGKVDKSINNANFHFGKYKLAVWHYLTDSNNWFMADQTLMQVGGMLNWFDRIPLEFNQDKDFDSYTARYSAYMRYSTGWSDWRWLYGHTL